MKKDFEANVKELENDLSAYDIAYILESRNEVVSSMAYRDRIDRALECLFNHPYFRDSIMEVYLVEHNGEEKIKCVGIEGIPQKDMEFLIDRTYTMNKNPREDIEKYVEGKITIPISLNHSGAIYVSIDEWNEKREKFLKHYVKNTLLTSIKHAIDYQKNAQLAITNSMTGLYNRGYLETALEKEIKIQSREMGKRKGLSIIMFDIDYFKNYNDNNGHKSGDSVIKTIAELLKHSRPMDIAARYGGEEFCLVMPDSSVEDAVKRAEEIRNTVERHIFPGGYKQPGGKLTISAGVANMPVHSIDGTHLLEYADKALYYSKKTGKNKVSRFDEIDFNLIKF